jgi:hypothetical protein
MNVLSRSFEDETQLAEILSTPGLLDSLSAGSQEGLWFFAMGPTKAVVRSISAPDAQDLCRWPTGHLFGSNAELRWSRSLQTAGNLVWAVGSPPPDVDLSAWESLEHSWTRLAATPDRPDHLQMWDPADKRIGHDIDFPDLIRTGRAVVTIATYADHLGSLAWIRYTGIIELQESQHG